MSNYWSTITSMHAARAATMQSRAPSTAAPQPSQQATALPIKAQVAPKPEPKPKGGRRPGSGRFTKEMLAQRQQIQQNPNTVGVQQQSYGLSPVEIQLAQLEKMVALRRELASMDTQGLAAPGSLGQPTVGKINSQSLATPAEMSAAPYMLGETPQTPDPRTVAVRNHVKTSSTAASVSPDNLHIPLQGGEAAVPTSFTPAGASQLAETDAKLAHSIAAPTRSLFRR